MATIIRHPNGLWTAMGAIPIGTSIFTVKEVIDETPFRREMNRRVGHVMTPEVKAQCGAVPSGPGRDDAFWRMVKVAQRASDVLVDKKVREALLVKLGLAVRKASNVAASIYQMHGSGGAGAGLGGFDRAYANGGSVGLVPASVSPRAAFGAAFQGPNPKVVVDLVQRIEINEPKANAAVLEMGARLSDDARARNLLGAIIDLATLGNAGRALRSLFLNHGMVKLVGVVDRRTAMHQQQRVLARG